MTKKRPDTTRTPLTMEELKHLMRFMPRELERMKLTDQETAHLRAINNARRERVTENAIRLKMEEEPILADLRAIGCEVESVWSLVKNQSGYHRVIPVLLKHLQRPYSDRTREGIARKLAVSDPEVLRAWPILVEEYRKAPMGWGIATPGDTEEAKLGAKGGLACALSASVTDERLPELIALAKDRNHGSSRLLLLSALKKRRKKNPLAAQAIDELASDPDLEKEIASWRKR